MEVSTEEYGNTQIISTDYAEAFYFVFFYNYRLSTFNICMRILARSCFPKCYWLAKNAS